MSAHKSAIEDRHNAGKAVQIVATKKSLWLTFTTLVGTTLCTRKPYDRISAQVHAMVLNISSFLVSIT